MQSAIQSNLFTSDFKTTPYWWELTKPPTLPKLALPRTADVVVIGSGYTGLHAAIQTACGGRQTLVVDAEQAGWGCSTRNGGQISTSVKSDLAELSRKYGASKARDILHEGKRSLDWIYEFVSNRNLDCDFVKAGRFHAAHNPRQFDKLAAAAKDQVRGLETDAVVIPRDQQHKELGTDVYYGGVLLPRHCSLHPGKYHAELVRLALEAGVQFVTGCQVTSINGQQGSWKIGAALGQVIAGSVVLATNGYTGKLTPWQQRRVIPIGSYVIATEEIPQAVMDRIMPQNRIVSDSRKVVYYYRPSPDRKCIVFGGRVSHHETDVRISAPKLHQALVRIFPELAQTRVRHSWMGFVAYTFDRLMHTGQKDGIYYAMGYCGSGVGMASYLGMRIGQQVIGDPQGKTAFDDLPFPTRPLYSGNPWFLGASIAYYRWLDSLNI